MSMTFEGVKTAEPFPMLEGDERRLAKWKTEILVGREGEDQDAYQKRVEVRNLSFAIEKPMTPEFAFALYHLIFQSEKEIPYNFEKYRFGLLKKMSPEMRAAIGREMFPNDPVPFREKTRDEVKAFVSHMREKYTASGGLSETINAANKTFIEREDRVYLRCLIESAMDLSDPEVMPVAFLHGKGPKEPKEHATMPLLYEDTFSQEAIAALALADLPESQLLVITQNTFYSPTGASRGPAGSEWHNADFQNGGFRFPKFSMAPIPGTPYVFMWSMYDYDSRFSKGDPRPSANHVECVMPRDHSFIKEVLLGKSEKMSQYALQFLFMAMAVSTENQIANHSEMEKYEVEKVRQGLNDYLDGRHSPPGSLDYDREPATAMLFGEERMVIAVPSGPCSPALRSRDARRREFSSKESFQFSTTVDRLAGGRCIKKPEEFPEGFPIESIPPDLYVNFEDTIRDSYFYNSPVVRQLELLWTGFTNAADYLDERQKIGQTVEALLRSFITSGLTQEEALQLSFMLESNRWSRKERDNYGGSMTGVRLPYPCDFFGEEIPQDILAGIESALPEKERRK